MWWPRTKNFQQTPSFMLGRGCGKLPCCGYCDSLRTTLNRVSYISSNIPSWRDLNVWYLSCTMLIAASPICLPVWRVGCIPGVWGPQQSWTKVGPSNQGPQRTGLHLAKINNINTIHSQPTDLPIISSCRLKTVLLLQHHSISPWIVYKVHFIKIITA